MKNLRSKTIRLGLVAFILFMGLLPCVSSPVYADTVVVFADPALEAAVRATIGIPVGDINQSDLNAFSAFSANGIGITNLSGMEYWTNLTSLTLRHNDITDLSYLSGLTNLIVLGLSSNTISNISVLSGLTNLTELDLSYNNVSNISALSGLTNLTELYLSYNNVSNISALSGLTNLTELYLNYNNVSDISAISGLTNLTVLGLDYNNVSNISALSGLTNLTALYLGYNTISDISALSGLTNLTELGLDYNNVSNISALSGLTNLAYLDLSYNNVSNISALSGLTNLTVLGLSSNIISNISSLVGVLASGDLWIENNPLNVHAYSTDIPAIQGSGVTVHFDAEPVPTVVDIIPPTGTSFGGTNVTITGTNFLDGATATINGTPCTSVVFVNSSTLTAVTPAGTGVCDVVVTNDVEYGTLTGGYTYIVPPTPIPSSTDDLLWIIPVIFAAIIIVCVIVGLTAGLDIGSIIAIALFITIGMALLGAIIDMISGI
jgi:hypothetical protein